MGLKRLASVLPIITISYFFILSSFEKKAALPPPLGKKYIQVLLQVSDPIVEDLSPMFSIELVLGLPFYF